VHFSSHHRDTIRKIFSHPTSGNIEWRDVLALLEYVGTTTEDLHGGGIAPKLRGTRYLFVGNLSLDIRNGITTIHGGKGDLYLGRKNNNHHQPPTIWGNIVPNSPNTVPKKRPEMPPEHRWRPHPSLLMEKRILLAL
jgi:hypothetical protein